MAILEEFFSTFLYNSLLWKFSENVTYHRQHFSEERTKRLVKLTTLIHLHRGTGADSLRWTGQSKKVWAGLFHCANPVQGYMHCTSQATPVLSSDQRDTVHASKYDLYEHVMAFAVFVQMSKDEHGKDSGHFRLIVQQFISSYHVACGIFTEQILKQLKLFTRVKNELNCNNMKKTKSHP